MPSMNPAHLVAALIQQSGKTGLQIATEVDNRNFQGTLHRFVNGRTPNPERATAMRIANYFGIKVDALYDPELAWAEAVRLGIDPGFVPPPVEPGKRKHTPPIAGNPVHYGLAGAAPSGLMMREPEQEYRARPAPGAWGVVAPLFTPEMIASVARIDLRQRQALSRAISSFLEAADPEYLQPGKARSA